MKRVRIGNGCGFWGDNVDAPVLLARAGRLDYLTLEYLAELTMSILALQKQRDPQAGFATDFLDVLERLCPLLKAQAQLKITGQGNYNSQFIIGSMTIAGGGTLTLNYAGQNLGKASEVFLVE